ncbi:MAG: hypothetical protein KF768_14420 [Phycisphaeraceae bacterium]|nr:hypothetical protein [Phycisphaeraceae bacterium]
MASRLSIAKPDIVKAFDALPYPVMRAKDISKVLEENRTFWRLAKATTLAAFTKFLVEKTRMRRIRIDLPHRPETLFAWGDVSPFVIAASIKPNAYICHFSAMRLHDLTDQVPETIYANHEQRPLPHPSGALTQTAIDAAFRRPQRLSKNVATMDDYRLCLINGKHTGQLGVIAMKDEAGLEFRVAGLERTLIDITVRPYYAGGVGEVLEAFRRAAGRVSVNKLSAMLKQMDFVYPYDQAIGFYLQHSGAYDRSKLELFQKREFTHDFYLTYAMKQKEYSAEWRLFFPEGL